jgi:hypothetical protein
MLCNIEKRVVLVTIYKLMEKKYHYVGTVPKSNRKVVEIDKIGIHDRSHSCIGTGTSLK